RKALFDVEMTQEEAKKSLGFKPDIPLVLVTGGSLGARTLNQTVIDAIAEGRAALESFQVLWQCGASDHERCTKAVEGILPENIHLTEFVSDMAVAYRAADLVVARAGAGTISELEDLGKPAILVPSPNVAEDHQRHNAEALASRGAAGMVLDADAAKQLWNDISTVVSNPETLRLLSENISAMALRDSDTLIVDTIDKVLAKTSKS
ncbi:MAG: UDP-N-acetylglucosamine--N-acetylmuramyl-(pentapeptide) pyrophosphoryl-undecaprenol N-acetylglucosamine transferase, partial [Muribaculaceae bacterium]|nr:UDP-N-acetylglucosamine--N-acetylmuramyl-(pentapeptide) pyrophosphoryl-undecaprenol N-acetylglucosamine transferase [Muribaculaceae bacterium]